MFGAGVPYIDDVPDKLVAVDVGGHDPRGPFGSSGASEAFQSSDHMAVINAINNAVGVRIYELPATKEKIKAGIDALAKGEPNPNKPAPYFLGSDMYDALEDIRNNPMDPSKPENVQFGTLGKEGSRWKDDQEDQLK